MWKNEVGPPLLIQIWHEWVTDNPFFRRDFRRWASPRPVPPEKRRAGIYLFPGRGWTPRLLLSVSAVTSALLLLGVHGLTAAMHPESRWWPPERLGLIVFWLLAVFHLLLGTRAPVPALSLAQEAKGEGLLFLRLLPMAPFELVGKLALSRVLLWAPLLLAPLPVYVLLLAYGQVDPLEVAALYFCLFALLLGVPSVSAVRGALAKLEPAAEAETQNSSSMSGTAWGLLACGGLAILVIMAIQLLGPLVGGALGWLRGQAGLDLARAFPLTLPAMVLRLLSRPRPFFAWEVIPLVPLALYWGVRTGCRLVHAGEAWRDPWTDSAQPAAPRGAAWKADRVLRTLAPLLVLGFLWKPAVLGGALGGWIGRPTAGGSVAVLILLAGVYRVMSLGESPEPEQDPNQQERHIRWRRALVLPLKWLAEMAVLGLALCLAAGVRPDEGPLYGWTVLGVLTAGTLLFGWGFQSLPITSAGLGFAVWISMCLGPLLVAWLASGIREAHLAVVWSPLYAFLRVFPPLWRDPVPLPLEAALAGPAAAGTMLLLVSLPFRGRAIGGKAEGVEAAPEGAPAEEPFEPDRIARVLLDAAGSRDDPILLLDLRRRMRRRENLLRGAISSAVGLLMVSLLARGIHLFVFGPSNAGSLPGGEFFLLGAGLLGGFLLVTVLLSITETVRVLLSAGRTGPEGGGRLVEMLLTPVSDAVLVRGAVAALGVDALPILAGGAIAAFFWIAGAVLFGASPLWLVAWLWAVAALPLLTLHLGFYSLASWPGKTPARSVFHIGAIAVPALAALVMLSQGGPRVPVPVLLGLSALFAATTLGLSESAAAGAIGLVRRSHDLERECSRLSSTASGGEVARG